ATQNPIEQEGTYPLPEAQLDRFLFKIEVGYPTRDEELALVRLHGNRSARVRLEDFDLIPVVGADFLDEAREMIAGLHMAEDMIEYVVDLVRATREHPSLLCGGSPRAANMLASAARASAILEGRDFVLADDVKRLTGPVLRHRLVLAPGAEVDGTTTDRVLGEIIEQIPAPR
ncbi:MAG: MoxR family ATPase, partial [Planctomycetes bacterium]|nr:MoxR family ATPase [Planctomycetota bacterium]